MGIPKRQRIGILRGDRKPVRDRGCRTMAHPAGAIDPAQRVGGARHAQKDEGKSGPDCNRSDKREHGGAAKRRQPQPQAEPR